MDGCFDNNVVVDLHDCAVADERRVQRREGVPRGRGERPQPGFRPLRVLLEHRRHNHHFSLFLPEVLQHFDLPHVAACAAPQRLTLLNAVNQRRERACADEVRREYTLTAEIYKRRGATGSFRVATTDTAPETLDACSEALRHPLTPGP